MYGLPKDFDGSPLIGRVLEMVCFNLNQISLHFENHAMIAVESSLVYKSSGQSAQTLSPPVTQTNLMQLVGRRVSGATAQPGGTLALVFDNKDVVECLDTSKNYESYQITVNGRTTVV